MIRIALTNVQRQGGTRLNLVRELECDSLGCVRISRVRDVGGDGNVWARGGFVGIA
jgi:hypothetical protein